MTRQLFKVLVWIIVLCTVLVTALLAATHVTERGALTAQGDGSANMRVYEGSTSITGRGTLTIHAREEIEISISGGESQRIHRAHDYGDSETLYTFKEFSGSATVNGSDYTVRLEGSNISLTARGAGTATLTGMGSYSVIGAGTHSRNGSWQRKPYAHEKRRVSSVKFGNWKSE